MRVARLVLSFLLILSSSPRLSSQQSAATLRRDPQALAMLRSSIAAMGKVPSDSTATGSVTVVAGSLTTQGTVQIETLGSAETSIQFQIPSGSWSVIYSNGQANRVESSTVTVLPLELAASSQCLYFPLPYLSDLLNNPDVALQFI